MGHGFLCQSLHRLHELSSNAHEQHSTTPTEYGEPSVSDSIRVTFEDGRRTIPICFTAAVSDATGRVQRTRLAAERGKRV